MYKNCALENIFERRKEKKIERGYLLNTSTISTF